MPRRSSVSVSFAVLGLIASSVHAQGFTGLPVEGAPLAEPGPYDVISEPATGSTGLLVFV